MISLRFEVLLLFAISVSVLGQNYIPQTCNILAVAPCICQDERGNFVDIRSIASIDLQPAFKDNPTPGNDANLYSWNPCYGFEEGADNSSCITDKDTAACKVSENRTTFENIGTQHSASFGHYDNGNLSLIYHSWDNKSMTIVSLYCDDTVEQAGFRSPGNMDTGFYWLQVRSKVCCPVPPTDELLDLVELEKERNPNSPLNAEPTIKKRKEKVSNPTVVSKVNESPGEEEQITQMSVPPSPEVTSMQPPGIMTNAHKVMSTQFTMPSPGVVTMTSGPNPDVKNDLSSIIIILLGILVVVSFIFGIMLAGQISKFRCHGDNTHIKYSKLADMPYVEDGKKSPHAFHI